MQLWVCKTLFTGDHSFNIGDSQATINFAMMLCNSVLTPIS
jgi:hypothetical protein